MENSDDQVDKKQKKCKTVTPEEVLKFNKITDKFLCPLSADTYNISFLEFTIRDLQNKQMIFSIKNNKEDLMKVK